VLVAVWVGLLLSQAPAIAVVDNEYLAELVARSRQLRLAQRPEWLKLVHYVQNRLSPGVHGLVVSPHFYNAPDGMTDPQAELEATLRSFYSDVQEDDRTQNPQCLFIARFAWLDEQLAFDARRLHRQVCARYQSWHSSLNPAGATLIFASAYVNSPSSMAGHTLLRIDSRDQDETTRLLAYSINFAAGTRETNGIAFAVNGLFGGYPGVFSMLPYYAKVREYSDLENRDIWEYRLALTPEELDRVLMHAWELGPFQFRYYFFDENCSYQLLALLQVARPDLDLTGSFHWWVAPSDTVRAVTARPDLIEAVVYRPSNATVIRHRLMALSAAERRLVRELSAGRIGPNDPMVSALPATGAAAVLEAGQDYVAYRRAIGRDDVANPAELAHELVIARSQLDVAPQMPDVPAPDVRPDQGHATSRASVGAGRWEGRNFQELSARGAYHDLMDADDGYVPGAQIEFLKLALRHYTGSTLRVENFTPLSILSLSPRDEFFKPVSWKFETGWLRVRMADGAEPLVFGIEGGAGVAESNERGTFRYYGLLEAGSRIDQAFSSGYQFGSGAMVGALFDLRPRWRAHAYARGFRYFLGLEETPWSLGLEQRFALTRDLALRVDVRREDEFRRGFNNVTVSVQYYF
jgi:Domain of unknown function (DUF4105)